MNARLSASDIICGRATSNGCHLLDWMRNRLEAIAVSIRRGRRDWLQSVHHRLDELRLYLPTNNDECVRYSTDHHAGQRVTTAPVESTINRLINLRMSKRQQMSGSQRGVHCLLQVQQLF